MQNIEETPNEPTMKDQIKQMIGEFVCVNLRSYQKQYAGTLKTVGHDFINVRQSGVNRQKDMDHIISIDEIVTVSVMRD